MAAPALPYRGDGSARPAGLALPPDRMALVRGRRPLKRWCYAGLYGEPLMLCAAGVSIGGLRQAFWAVWDREAAVLHERTTFVPGRVRVRAGLVRFAGAGVRAHLALEPRGEAVEVVSRHGASYIWTRKQPVLARGRVTAGGRERRVELMGLVDDSAGYHARETAWRWSAGVGMAHDGRTVAWNVVDGVHDARVGSERTVWVDGAAHEVAPVSFAADLGAVAFADGARLRCHAEAQRSRRDDLGLFASDYVQPFGTFSGTLPVAGPLQTGFGVMERHDVRW